MLLTQQCDAPGHENHPTLALEVEFSPHLATQAAGPVEERAGLARGLQALAALPSLSPEPAARPSRRSRP